MISKMAAFCFNFLAILTILIDGSTSWDGSISEMQYKIAEVIQEVKDISEENDIFSNGLKKIDHEYDKYMLDITNKIKENERALEELKIIKGAVQDTYAFSAYASESSTYNNGVALRYDAVITNTGGAFDSSSYSFICSVRGYYMFSFAVYSDENGMRASLFRDGYRMCTAYAYGGVLGATDEVDQGSNTCIMFCEAGQTVVVQAILDGNFLIGGGNRHSTFSGFLIESL